jgi:hypothetical protein
MRIKYLNTQYINISNSDNKKITISQLYPKKRTSLLSQLNTPFEIKYKQKR